MTAGLQRAGKQRDFVVAVVAALSGLVFGALGFGLSCASQNQQEELQQQQNALQERQDEFQQAVEERQASPALVPGVGPAQRGDSIKVFTEGAGVRHKRADVLSWKPPNLILPIRNVGEGRAVITGFKDLALVDTCADVTTTTFPEPHSVEDRPRVGYYNVAPGESQQLIFSPHRRSPVVAAEAKRLRLGRRLSQKHVHIALRYSGGQQDRVRWTCTDYVGLDDTTAGNRKVRYGWALQDVHYDDCTKNSEAAQCKS